MARPGSVTLFRRAGLLAIGLVLGACTPLASAVPASPLGSNGGRSSGQTGPAVPSSTPPIVAEAYGQVGVGWESQFVFAEPHGLGAIKGLIAGGPGFVMWSDEADGRPGFLVGSGVAGWQQVDTRLTGRTMLAVVADRSGLIGLASHAPGSIERWQSTVGISWDETPTTGIDGTPSALLVTSTGFVAAGVDRAGCGLASWTSSDAMTWTAAGPLPGGTSTCAGGQGGPTVDVLLAGTGGLLAVGHLSGPEPSIWTSTDAQSWRRALDPASGGIAGIAPVGSGYVAVGHDDGTPAGAAAWVSPDGLSWIAVPVQASFAGATMTAVVALADGSLASVGRELNAAGAPTFAAWTSADGHAWRRSPAPLCQNVDVCDASGSMPPLLARNGQRLVAYDGSINIVSSPPLTVGLRPGTLVLHVDSVPADQWSSGSVVGYCATAADNSGTMAFGAAYPRLSDVGAAFGSSSYVPSLQLVLGRDLSLQLLAYDRGDDAGFTKEPISLEPGASATDPGRVIVNVGSTPMRGRLEFHDLPVDRADRNLPRVAPVDGWLTWSCG